MKQKILVLDDDESILELVKGVLQDYEVISFIDPDSAEIELMEKGLVPDLMLIDVRLPKIHGDDFYKKVIQKEELKNVKTIFITASTRISELSLHGPNVRYFSKPFDIDELRKQVKDFLSENDKKE